MLTGDRERDRRLDLLGQTGGTVWLTGLPASGKSTLARAIESRLLASGRLAFVLDGDDLRSHLNRDLGFSAADRAENVRRAAEVASLFSGCGAVTLVSLISPYREGRRLARALHAARGLAFVEVYLSTPLGVCEQRDPKGLYRRARAGEIAAFTGISDPYEPPESPELCIDASCLGPEAGAERVIASLRAAGLLGPGVLAYTNENLRSTEPSP